MRVKALHAERLALSGQPNSLAGVATARLARSGLANRGVSRNKTLGECWIDLRPRCPARRDAHSLLGRQLLNEMGAGEPCVRGERRPVGKNARRDNYGWKSVVAHGGDAPRLTRHSAELCGHECRFVGWRARFAWAITHLTLNTESRKAVQGPRGAVVAASPLSICGDTPIVMVLLALLESSVTTTMCSPRLTIPS